ncbi:minor tail protein [Microbacterium phage Gingerbug]|nr:minor tail protein [Microbacterium phage Gingerbug]
MRVDDLTVEVRDRTLKRVGQITPRYLDLKARTKWCGVGEWTVTLPGNHPMVPYLAEPGSGLLVTGPSGEVLHPPTYTDWVEERRNYVLNSSLDSTYSNADSGAKRMVDLMVGSAVPANTPVRIQVVVELSHPLNLEVGVRNTIGSAGGGNVWSIPLEAGRHELSLEATGWTAPTANAGVTLIMRTGWSGGETFYATAAIVEPADNWGGFFDGSTPGSDLRRTRWLGPVGNSQSVLETRVMTRTAWREMTYGPLFSGPTRTPTRVRNQQNPDGTFTFSGVTDEILLQGARAFPDPTIGDPQASSQSKTNDTRTGTTEALLRQFVAYNITFDQAPPERVRGLRQYLDLSGSSLGRGLTQQKSPRFQNLLELLQEMIAFDPSLGFRVVQVGSMLEFQVLDARDRTAFVRFDVENGTIVSEEVQAGGPVVTDAIVAGQGEGKERTIVQRRSPEAIAAEAEWGVVFEEFIDQRDTDDLGELQQSGDEALTEGAGGTAVKMVPSDDTTMQVNVDWRQGDVVTTVVSGVETAARVTEVAYSATSSGVMAGAALGDVSGFTQKDAESSKVQSIDSRVSNLERASAGPVDWARIINEPAAFPPAAHTHAWGEVTGKPTTFPSTWGTVSGKPTAFPPAAHVHSAADITSGTLDDARLPVRHAEFSGSFSLQNAGAAASDINTPSRVAAYTTDNTVAVPIAGGVSVDAGRYLVDFGVNISVSPVANLTRAFGSVWDSNSGLAPRIFNGTAEDWMQGTAVIYMPDAGNLKFSVYQLSGAARTVTYRLKITKL